MKALVIAVQFMTRLPLPPVAAEERDYSLAIRWFPAAGVVVGACIAGAAWLGLQRDPWAGALLALLAWVALTGALHLDGLGDIADAAGAGHADRTRLSAVLADPHIGSFGVTAIGMQLLAKLVLLRLVLESHGPWPVVLVPVLARIGPLFWAIMLPPLHVGMGTLFRAGANGWVAGGWLVPVCAVAGFTAPAVLLALPAVLLWARWLRQRIGGISGDGHGAGIELLESGALAAMAFAG